MRFEKAVRLLLLYGFLLVTLLPVYAGDLYEPREGDLLFFASSSTDFSNAIVDATAHKDSLKFSHVAIVAEEDCKHYVLEASSDYGVVRTEWGKFMDTHIKSTNRPIVVKRVIVDFPIKQAIALATTHLGEPYDWSFQANNGKMYCSELVYDSYRYVDGTPLFSSYPMSFKDKDGAIPAFWTNLFEKLREPIPEGVLGTNPNDMAKSPILVEVCRLP